MPHSVRPAHDSGPTSSPDSRWFQLIPHRRYRVMSERSDNIEAGLTSIPPELLTEILLKLSLRQLLSCKQVRSPLVGLKLMLTSWFHPALDPDLRCAAFCTTSLRLLSPSSTRFSVRCTVSSMETRTLSLSTSVSRVFKPCSTHGILEHRALLSRFASAKKSCAPTGCSFQAAS